MINNRQAGRRNRGRNNARPNNGGSGGGGNRGGADNGNRIDNRARGNATQLLEKYRNMARDAQLAGDRVNAEYYLQFADHYFRVLADNRARQEEQQQRYRRNDEGFEDSTEEFDGNDDGNDEFRMDQDGRFDHNDRFSERQGNERVSNDRQGNDRQGNDRPNGDRQTNDRQNGERQGQNENRNERQDRNGDGNGNRNDRQAQNGDGYVRNERQAPNAESNGSRNENRRDRARRPDRAVPVDGTPQMAAPQPIAAQAPAPQVAPEALAPAVAPQVEEAPRPRRGRPPRRPVEEAGEAEGLDIAILPPSIARADNDSETAEEAPRKRTRRARPATEAAE